MISPYVCVKVGEIPDPPADLALKLECESCKAPVWASRVSLETARRVCEELVETMGIYCYPCSSDLLDVQGEPDGIVMMGGGEH